MSMRLRIAKKVLIHRRLQLLAPAISSVFASAAQAQIALNGNYAQNFFALAPSGTSNVVPAGWALAEAGSNANLTYTADNGTANTGETYSYGLTGFADRAFGGVQSGSLIPTNGFSFTNDTSYTISAVSIGYFGEFWRAGGARANGDQLDFQYSTNATTLLVGTYLDANSLDYVGPTPAASAAVDGNQNRSYRGGAITGLGLAPGQTMFIRWNDVNATGSDDGLAVDDFRLSLMARTLQWDSNPSVTGIQDGGGTLIDGGVNWVAGGSQQKFQSGSPDLLVFGDSSGGPATVTISGPVTAGGVRFAATSGGAYTIAGSATDVLTLSAGVTAEQNSVISAPVELNGHQDWNVASGATLTASGTLSGSGGLSKGDSGTLLLTGNSTYSGPTHVAAGTLEVAGSIQSLRVTVGPNGLLRLSGAGDHLPNGGTVTVDSGQTVSAPNSFFNLNGTTETIGSLYLTNGQVDTSGGTLIVSRDIVSKPSTNSLGVSVINGNLDFASASIVIAPESGSPDPDLQINAAVSGTSAAVINKENSGFLRFTGDSSLYAGAYSANGGRTILSGTGAFPNVSETTIKNNSTFRLDNLISTDSGNRFSDTAPVNVGQGTLHFRAATTGSSETIGALNTIGGAMFVQVSPGTSGTTVLTTSIGAHTVGGSLHLRPDAGTFGVVSGGTPKLVLAGQANGFVNGYTIVQTSDAANADFAFYDSTLGVRFPTTGTDNTAVDTANANIKITASNITTAYTSGPRTYNSITLSPTGTGTMLLTQTGVITLSSGGIVKGQGTGSAGLTATGGYTSLTNELSIFVNSGSLLLNSAIINNGANPLSFTKSGVGTLFLTNSPTSTGTVTVNGGTLLVSAANINAVGTIVINAGTIQTNQSERISNTAPFFLNGAVNSNGSGSISNLSIPSAITETIGPLTMQGGGRVFGSGTVLLNGTVTRDTVGTGIASLSISNVDLGGVQRVFSIGDNQYTAVDMQVGGVITNGGLTKQGAGTLRVLGANNYALSTVVTDGTLQIGANNSVPATAGVSVTGPGVFDLGGFNNSVGTLSLTSGRVAGNGTITPGGTVTNASGSSTIEANVALSAARNFDVTGTLVVEGGITGAFALNKIGSGTLVYAGSVAHTSTTVSNGTLQFGNGGITGSATGGVQNDSNLAFNRSDRFSYGGSISGTGNVYQNGKGTTRLSGTNSYAGTTTVNDGVLLVNGTHTGGAGYTISLGGTLGGTGSTSSGVTVNQGGTIAPGASVGALTIGQLTLDGVANGNPADNSTITIEVDEINATADKLVHNNGATPLDISGATLKFSFVSGTITSFTQSFVIVNDKGTGVPTGTPAFDVVVPASVMSGLIEYALSYVDADSDTFVNDIQVSFVSVPEPTTLGLVLLSNMFLARRRRA